ncbi:Lsr2 family protein [Nocardia sp. JMUB6875]|uniref:histone-like nucleoid-structuring protein Lsr2 n=1 Tax=Nocardia sp. JMUB6875 TaxID=3158170 RepID=UPI0032E614EF
MARKVIVELVDDFDGKSKAQETVQFSIDGVAYEIDLSESNGAKLRAAYERWTPHARKTGRAPRSKDATGRARSTADREQTQAMRDWARKNGFEVSSRGRISAEIAAAYSKANK